MEETYTELTKAINRTVVAWEKQTLVTTVPPQFGTSNSILEMNRPINI